MSSRKMKEEEVMAGNYPSIAAIRRTKSTLSLTAAFHRIFWCRRRLPLKSDGLTSIGHRQREMRSPWRPQKSRSRRD